MPGQPPVHVPGPAARPGPPPGSTAYPGTWRPAPAYPAATHVPGWRPGEPRRVEQWRSWRRGDRFDRAYARNYEELDYRRYHGLRRPPRGYRWVRSGDDAVLVAITTGIVLSVVLNAVH
ncbi:MAG: RcnB family protein [Sphingomonadales bacterium]|nr:RcnB family protein [Sphingomonadales bacterium]